MDEIIDWSNTRTELEKLCLLFVCEKCRNPLQTPCSFEMCDHYFCKQCAINLTDNGDNCPTCHAVLWREHLQPNLRIAEAMKVCKKIEDLVRKDSSSDLENMSDEDNDSNMDQDHIESDSEDDSRYIMNLENEIHMDSDDDDTDEGDANVGVTFESDNAEANKKQLEVPFQDDTSTEENIQQDNNEDNVVLKDESKKRKSGGSLIALAKGVQSKLAESEDIDFDIDKDDSVITVNEVQASPDEDQILTAIKSKKTGTSDMPISISMSPSPPKSQFSEAVTDEQCAQGVQRNPKCMIKKPKVTYGGKKKGVVKLLQERTATEQLQTAQNTEADPSIFDFSSGTVTKPISFDNKEDKENVSEQIAEENTNMNVSTSSIDPFIFSSGTITKPIDLGRVNKNPTKKKTVSNRKKDFSDDSNNNEEEKNTKSGKKRNNKKKNSAQDVEKQDIDTVASELSSDVAPKTKRVSFETHIILKDERKSMEFDTKTYPIRNNKQNTNKPKKTSIYSKPSTSKEPIGSKEPNATKNTNKEPVASKKLNPSKKLNASKDANASKESDANSEAAKTIEKKENKNQKPKARNLEKKNKNGETPLHTACIKGKYERAKELLEQGAQANTKDFNGWTPLHEASNHGFADIVALLLDYNAIIDCVAGEDNDTPLHDAVSNNRVEVAKVLLQRGAPTNIKNRVGLYPEGYASTSEMKTVFKELNMFENMNLTDNQLDTSIASTSTVVGPFVISTTNIKANERAEIQKCCDLFGGKIVSEFDDDVTHIVCGTDKNMISSSRTMKYLLGVLTGKWLVTYKWITDSIKHKKWQPELSYEVKGSLGACEDVPQKSRMNNFKCLPKLFEGCSFYLSGVYSNHLPKEKVMNIVTLGGGKILYREPKTSDVDPLIAPLPHEMNKLKLGVKIQHPDVIFHAKENSAQVCCKEYIIYDDQENPSHKTIFSPVLCTAPVAWLLDCISNFQILDIRDAYDVNDDVKSSQN